MLSRRPLTNALLLIVLLAVLPTSGSAQLGGLKKKLQSKVTGSAGPAAAPGARAPKQWTAGEASGGSFTAAELDQLIEEWKAENAYNAMTEKEKAKKDAADEAARDAAERKRDERDKCVGTAMNSDMMAMQTKMQQRTMELAKAGDPNAAGTAGAEMQKAMMDGIAKKCGPEVRVPTLTALLGTGRRQERVYSYLAVRSELGVAGAGALILATPEEIKAIESHLEELMKLAEVDMKPIKK